MMKTIKLLGRIVLAAAFLLSSSLPAHADTASKSFTATGAGSSIMLYNGDSFTYSVSGTFVGTVIVERSFDGTNYTPTVVTSTTSASGQIIGDGSGRQPLYRFRCTAYTSGTIVTSITGNDDPVQAVRNHKGAVVLQVNDHSVAVTGNISASGTLVNTGNVTNSSNTYFGTGAGISTMTSAGVANLSSLAVAGAAAVTGTATLGTTNISKTLTTSGAGGIANTYGLATGSANVTGLMAAGSVTATYGVTAATGNFTNTSSTQAYFYGYSKCGRTNADSGTIQLGTSLSESGYVDFCGNGNGVTTIGNSYSAATSRVDIALSGVLGAQVTPLSAIGSGFVGIMTTAPATTLDVNGTSQFGTTAKSTFSTTGALSTPASINTAFNTGLVYTGNGVYVQTDGNEDTILRIAKTGKILRIKNFAGTTNILMDDTGNVSIGASGGVSVTTFTTSGQMKMGTGAAGGTATILGGVSVSSVSQCGTAALPTGNGTAGKITTAGTAVTTCAITWTPAYANGSVCDWQDNSRNLAFTTVAEGVASSTVTFTGVWTAGDVIQYHCSGY